MKKTPPSNVQKLCIINKSKYALSFVRAACKTTTTQMKTNISNQISFFSSYFKLICFVISQITHSGYAIKREREREEKQIRKINDHN
jgi:hypothetical protein